MTKEKKFSAPEFCEFWSAFMWHETIFLSYAYILIMIAEDTCATTTWNVASETFQSHATKLSFYGNLQHEHEDLFLVRNTF